MSSDKQDRSGLSLTTLMVASVSSVVAAIVVSRLWGAGTLIGAALTPVIIALVTELLHRPTRAISAVRDSRARAFDPVEEGRRGLREGDLASARPLSGATPERRMHRVDRTTARRRLVLAVLTRLVAFGIATLLLTGSELVLGRSSVSSPERRTTYFGGRASERADRPQEDVTRTPATTTSEPSQESQTTPREETGTATAPTPTTPPPGSPQPAPSQQPGAQPAPQQPPPGATTPTPQQPPPTAP